VKLNREIINKIKPLIGLLLFSMIISFLNPRFLTWFNILNIFRQTSINSIIAAGKTFVILTGGIDLSVGSVLAFCGAVAAYLAGSSLPIPLVIIITLMLGAVLGMITGTVISLGKVRPLYP